METLKDVTVCHLWNMNTFFITSFQQPSFLYLVQQQISLLKNCKAGDHATQRTMLVLREGLRMAGVINGSGSKISSTTQLCL